MGPSQKVLWKLYAGVLGTVTTIVATKLIESGWKAATGENPPDPNDPETSLTRATIWAVASGLGVGVAQLLMNRYTARRWATEMGTELPKPNKVKVKV